MPHIRNNNLDESKHGELGFEDRSLQELLVELQNNPTPAPHPPAQFTADLRRRLLEEYQHNPQPLLSRVWRFAGATVALGVLAFAVFGVWFALSQSPVWTGRNGIASVRPTVEVVYDRLRILMPAPRTGEPVEVTAESWQTVDGRQFRGQALDDEGNYYVFAQSDGQQLWRGTFESPPGRMEYVAQQPLYTLETTNIQGEPLAAYFVTPPFFNSLGWEGLVQPLVDLDWKCGDLNCLIETLSYPPLGVAYDDGYDEYDVRMSTIRTETREDGRELSVVQLNYSSEGTNWEEVPHYRQIKFDAATFEVVEVADYGEEGTLFRRIERLERQRLNPADLPPYLFTIIPRGLEITYRSWDAVVSGTGSDGLVLRAQPGDGRPIGILPEGSELTMLGDRVEVDGVVWQKVAASPVGSGWVDAAFLTFSGAGSLFARSVSPDHTLSARLDNGLNLLGYDLDGGPQEPGQIYELTLYWETIEQPPKEYRLFIHLVDETGTVAAQWDEPLAAGSVAISTLAAGQPLSDPHALFLPPDLQVGSYQLVVGMYDEATGERATIQEDEGLTEIILATLQVGGAEEVETADSQSAPTATIPDSASRGYDAIEVYEVSPQPGMLITGTAPITFEVKLFYDVTSLPEAEVVAKLVEKIGATDMRGVATGEVTVQEGEGMLTLTFPFYPARELNAPADLGLIVQMQPDERSAPVLIEAPEAFHWRYEP